MKKPKWQEEFDALPEWVQKMVRAASSTICYGTHTPDLVGMSVNKDDYHGFQIVLHNDTTSDWWDGWSHMRELSEAITAPWPPPAAPVREKRSMNVVELMDDEQAFDQPCAFGNRCGGHAVYCHNEAWPNAPRKCRRTWYTGGVERDEDCPGFVMNPDHKPTGTPN